MRARAETQRDGSPDDHGGLAAAGAALRRDRSAAFHVPGVRMPRAVQDGVLVRPAHGVSSAARRSRRSLLSETDKASSWSWTTPALRRDLVRTYLRRTPNYVTDVTTGSGVSPSVAEALVRAHRTRASPRLGVPGQCAIFNRSSTDFYGPAPRPTDWVNIEVTPGRFLRGRPRDAGCDTGSRERHCPRWRLLLATTEKATARPSVLSEEAGYAHEGLG